MPGRRVITLENETQIYRANDKVGYMQETTIKETI
jgi:hypothetical protein